MQNRTLPAISIAFLVFGILKGTHFFICRNTTDVYTAYKVLIILMMSTSGLFKLDNLIGSLLANKLTMN